VYFGRCSALAMVMSSLMQTSSKRTELNQAHTQNFFLGDGPDARYNLFDFESYVIKIML
jgi:hypothetical protein